MEQWQQMIEQRRKIHMLLGLEGVRLGKCDVV